MTSPGLPENWDSLPDEALLDGFAGPTLGLECAGRVAAVGDGVSEFAPGDRVMALLGGGGYADRIAVHERMLMAIPANLSFTQAASIPEVFLTAFDALFQAFEAHLHARCPGAVAAEAVVHMQPQQGRAGHAQLLGRGLQQRQLLVADAQAYRMNLFHPPLLPRVRRMP